jgi:hypothetical protein
VVFTVMLLLVVVMTIPMVVFSTVVISGL